MRRILLFLLLAALLCGCAAPAEPAETTLSASDPAESTEGPTEDTTEDPTEESTQESTEAPTRLQPLEVVATATVVSTGDVLMHDPVLTSGKLRDGSYDFSYMFRHLVPYLQQADYAVANLEGTLCGTENGYKIGGYPRFNAPDVLAQNLKDAGFDMLLTANNHCYDTGTAGVQRTLQVLADTGLASLGTQSSPEDAKYRVVELNGIRVGMLCYTFSTTQPNGLPAINGYYTKSEDLGTVNVFDASRPESFYADLEAQMALARADGAQVIMLYIHWGEEFSYTQNASQSAMAQAICDLGVDVIVGGHAHMVQPMELLTSTLDENHKTVCLYSMGNAVSNQRDGYLKNAKSAHTEDGVLFSVTFARHSDGSVAVQDVDLIPCWVYMYNENWTWKYEILPLEEDSAQQWQSLFSLPDESLTDAQKSWDRTVELIAPGLADCREWLALAQQQRMEAHLENQ